LLAHLDRLASMKNLVWPAELLSLCPGAQNTSLDPLSDKLALEFGKGSHQVHEQSRYWIALIGVDVLGYCHEAHAQT
jgi:hypothetical protein